LKSYLIFLSIILVLSYPLLGYAESGTIVVEIEGILHEINYDVEGVSVLNIDTDSVGIALIFGVQVADSVGPFQVTLERAVIDSMIEGEDIPFFVLLDGEDIEVSETSTTETARTILILLPIGTEEVEILGTSIGSTALEVEPEVLPEVEEEVEISEPEVLPEVEEEVEISEPEVIAEVEEIIEEPEESVTPTKISPITELFMSSFLVLGVLIVVALVIGGLIQKFGK